MKNFKKFSSLAIVALAVVMVSCKKESVYDINLSQQVIGNYNGDLTTSSPNTINPATTDITRINDYTVEIHCYGQDIDTTFNMELYEDGGMMRVCNTSQDFEKEYGHKQSENHHSMGMNNEWTNWGEHMSIDHSNGNDQHYGVFNMDNNSFDYTFNIKSASGNYTQRFVGKK